MQHFVYKYVYNNTIIYVGKAKNSLKRRLNQHGTHQDNIDKEFHDYINDSDIYYLEFDSSIICDMVETCLINMYNPVCNKAKKVENFSESHIAYNEQPDEWKPYRINGEIVYKHAPAPKKVNTKAILALQQKTDELAPEIKRIINSYIGRGLELSSYRYNGLRNKLNELWGEKHTVNWYLRRVDFNGHFERSSNKKKQTLVRHYPTHKRGSKHDG